MTQARLIPAVAGGTLESPVWSHAEQCLYLIDIPGRELLRYTPDDGTVKRRAMPSEPGALALCESGGLLVALRTGIFHFNTVTAALTHVADPPYNPDDTRFNDGRCDAQGRFWVGSIYEPRDRAEAAFYRLDADASLHRVYDGVTTGNGLAFSPDGRTGYCADTQTRKVWAFELDAQGNPSERRVHIDLAAANIDGRPDGAAVDSEGCYWVALIDTGRVARFDPDGKLMQYVELPVRWPTCPCFGGPELRTLYVTNLRTGRKPEQLAQCPDAGTLVAVEVDVAGLPERAAAICPESF